MTDNSQNQHKLLIHCSNAELFEERPFRQENIRLEQARKVKRLKPFYILSLVLFVVAAGWATINDKADLASFLMGAASLFVAYLSLEATIKPNTFQMDEQNAVNEINKLLKQRRAE
nr:hypothetical protein [uncultured Massilia sp.]